MASAIDDLRYISRYGYRDPWAEATKSITDSLLAYTNSKFKRDALLADYKDKAEQKTYDRERDDKLDAYELYQGETTAEGRNLILQNPEFVKHFPSGFADAQIPINNSIITYKSERDRRFGNISKATEVTPGILEDLKWLERNIPGSESGTRARVGAVKTSLIGQYDDQNKTNYITYKAGEYAKRGLLTIKQQNAILDELPKSVTNSGLMLEDALESNLKTVDQLKEFYLDHKKLILQGKDLKSPDTINDEVTELEKGLSLRHMPAHVNRMKHPDGSPFSFTDKLAWMAIGRPDPDDEGNKVYEPFYEKYPGFYKNKMDKVFDFSTTPVVRDSSVVASDGTVSESNVSAFHADSDARFAVTEENFAMPPESQVELRYANGTTKVVSGENAWKQLKRGDVVYANSNKSGINLKIGVGTNPVLTKRADSKIPGLFADESTMDVGVVYQNPTKRQYESTSKPARVKGVGRIAAARSPELRDTAFSTRNIKLKSGDLLIDKNNGTYHEVLIILPEPGKRLKFTSTDEEFKTALQRNPLDETIFRIGGEDLKSEELIKKFMIPMTGPQPDKPEEQVSLTSKLISVTPMDKDSTWVADSTAWMTPVER